MQNLLQIWQGLNGRKRVIIIGATLAVFLSILGMSRIAGTHGMSLLYAGLDSAAAGDVIAALDQRSVSYEVRGQAIFVDESQRDSLRMSLAAEGLPANAGTGYELLDSLSGFGTTSQMFDAAYWRAKEGELTRTILSNPQIRAARVHIAQAPIQPFQRAIQPSASVTITSVGGNLSPVQAKALRHIIAASIPGMSPDKVDVIDSVAGLITQDEGSNAPGVVADDRATEIKQNVERLLAARVGTGRAVVEVAVDVETDAESIKERRFDPQGRVAISTESSDQKGTNSQNNSDVTVASNLPNNTNTSSGNKSENSETRERVNYEVSETNRELIKTPGAVKKISIAVLVDGVATTAADGTITHVPRPEEELVVLRELVSSAAGLDQARGDVLTLKSLAFEPISAGGDLVEASIFSFGTINLMTIIQTAVLALVSLFLGLFVLRPILSSGATQLETLQGPQGTLALPKTGNSTGEVRVLTGEIDESTDLPPLSTVSTDDEGNDPVSRLRRLIDQRQTETVEILRGWMEYEEETN